MTYAIRETYHALASGTRVELVDPQNLGFDKIASARGGYVTVRLVHMGKKFQDQNSRFVKHLVAANGAFDIEADNLVKLRERTI